MANRDFFWIDLHYKNEPRLIATGVLPTEDGLLLIDPGPDRALEGLQRGLQRRGFNLDDVSALLLTHIHLDHAGATGTIVGRHLAVEVGREPVAGHVPVRHGGPPTPRGGGAAAAGHGGCGSARSRSASR